MPLGAGGAEPWLALGCDAQPEPLTPHLPAAAPLDTLLSPQSSCALAGAEAARLLPQDTAAMVVFDRPRELVAALTGSDDLREAATNQRAALEQAQTRLRETLGTGVVWCRPAEGPTAHRRCAAAPRP